MARSITAPEVGAALWSSAPIGRPIDLRLCHEQNRSPQLIVEEKVFRSAVRAQTRSIVYFIGTLIADDESQRLTYVIDRSAVDDGRSNGFDTDELLAGEFVVPMQCNYHSSAALDELTQTATKNMNSYCYSALPIELHRFSYLCGQMCIRSSASVNIDLSFDLITTHNSFTLTPINPTCVHISPTALLKSLAAPTGISAYRNQAHFGYCSLDRLATDRILLLFDNDPHACTLPLVGIWVSGVTDIQCSFVWAACLRYCMNASLQQRLRTGVAQSFLLACFPSTSHGQCDFYEVSMSTMNSTSSAMVEHDLWKSSKQITIPNQPFDPASSTQFPYDFPFQRVRNTPHPHTSQRKERPPDNHLLIIPPTNTNGSMFGFPRPPPTQSAHPQPSWDMLAAAPITTTPKRRVQSPALSFVPSPDPSDDRWKAELIERMHSYESQFLSLTKLVHELVNAQQQSSSFSTPTKTCEKRDVAVQSEPSSPYVNPDPHVSPPIDRNPVDILKPIFQYIDNQQRKQQHTALPTNEDAEPVAPHSPHTPIQQQHVTSTRTTGISFISNGMQMQFINQQSSSSTTTVFPPPTSPHKSENNLSVEVHALEMKYLEDDQLAAAIECDRPAPAAGASASAAAAAATTTAAAPSPAIADKSLSFETQEYLQRYGLFPDANK